MIYSLSLHVMVISGTLNIYKASVIHSFNEAQSHSVVRRQYLLKLSDTPPFKTVIVQLYLT